MVMLPYQKLKPLALVAMIAAVMAMALVVLWMIVLGNVGGIEDNAGQIRSLDRRVTTLENKCD